MGVLRLGRSVTWSFCGWTYRQSTYEMLTFSVDQLMFNFYQLSSTSVQLTVRSYAEAASDPLSATSVFLNLIT